MMRAQNNKMSVRASPTSLQLRFRMTRHERPHSTSGRAPLTMIRREVGVWIFDQSPNLSTLATMLLDCCSPTSFVGNVQAGS